MFADVTDFCRLVLLRSPELGSEHQDVAVGSGSAPIGRRGRATVAQWLPTLAPLPVSAVHVAAGQEQCVQPGQVLATARSVELCESELLVDQAMGSWQGRRWSEIAASEGERVEAFFAHFGETRAPGGESLGEAVERVLTWWTGLQPASLGKTLAVVTAGGLISGLAAAMLGLRLSRCVSLNLPHGGIGILDCYANGVRIAAWNPTALPCAN